jgi:hypothetical protein
MEITGKAKIVGVSLLMGDDSPTENQIINGNHTRATSAFVPKSAILKVVAVVDRERVACEREATGSGRRPQDKVAGGVIIACVRGRAVIPVVSISQASVQRRFISGEYIARRHDGIGGTGGDCRDE